ncbi:hypothetical protein GE09DRAFT_1129053 [Coniochaeta sp. 2T2.1]|nr:hypothetical protein GE09DRAFT_1129053 [Coniochaeta sp. 2T2.1]
MTLLCPRRMMCFAFLTQSAIAHQSLSRSGRRGGHWHQDLDRVLHANEVAESRHDGSLLRSVPDIIARTRH